MKKLSLMAIATLFFVCQAYSQKTSRSLEKTMDLIITKSGGANGAGVVWVPKKKTYFAAMAGNVAYPLTMFDAKGKDMTPGDITTMADVRGIWYNTTTNTLQANCYNDFGWVEYDINPAGVPSGVHTLVAGMSQPDAQSVGAYDDKNNVVYFLNTDAVTIEKRNMRTGRIETSMSLYPGISDAGKAQDADEYDIYDSMDDYNFSPVYTGIKGGEIGLINVGLNRIELYDLSTGLMSQTLQLPAGQTPELQSVLNFSYANGMYWIFNKVNRIWVGFK